jgi:hypothetical protein
MFAALFSGQLVAAAPSFSRKTAALGFIRVIQLFLFDWRRHYACSYNNLAESGVLSISPRIITARLKNRSGISPPRNLVAWGTGNQNYNRITERQRWCSRGWTLLARLAAQPEGTVVAACGASCRHQIEHLSAHHPRHLAELLAEALA